MRCLRQQWNKKHKVDHIFSDCCRMRSCCSCCYWGCCLLSLFWLMLFDYCWDVLFDWVRVRWWVWFNKFVESSSWAWCLFVRSKCWNLTLSPEVSRSVGEVVCLWKVLIFTDSVGSLLWRSNELTIAAENMKSLEYRVEERITRFICSSIHPSRGQLHFSWQTLVYPNNVLKDILQTHFESTKK